MIKTFFIALLTFIALVNPVQKIFVIFSLQKSYSSDEIKTIVNKATITAFAILVLFMALGSQILTYVFNIEMYAFQVISGVVLILNGMLALQKGAFLNIDTSSKITDIITVPIAVPMIAGPATITAVVAMPMTYGVGVAIAALVVAIFLNWLIMRESGVLGKFMVKYNILNPLLRIFGLIVAAIGMQMVFNGVKTFVSSI